MPLDHLSLSDWTSASGLLHILASWNTDLAAGNKVFQLYVNGVSDFGTPTDAAVAFSVDWTQGDFAIGATALGAAKFAGAMGELYVAPGQFLDLSVQANRRLFRTASGKPRNLLTSGAPTAVMYHSLRAGYASANDFRRNLGTGGDFTVTGSLDVGARL